MEYDDNLEIKVASRFKTIFLFIFRRKVEKHSDFTVSSLYKGSIMKIF